MNIIESNGKLHILVRAINKTQFKTKDDVKFYMEYIKCDHTLQHQDKYLFVRYIDDIEAEEISETSSETIKLKEEK